jgi:hypothetical protein
MMMSVRDQLLALQWSQLKHDEAYHKDVVILSLADRMKHMALHNAKYTGHLFEAIDTGDASRVAATLTDAFIIALASANTLNQDLGEDLAAFGEAHSLRTAGEQLSTALPRDAADPLWIVRRFAGHNGHLAKLCESWDHLESVPFRDGMKASVLALLKVVLAESFSRAIDLAAAYNSRIRMVEARSIFDKQFREGAGGEA